MSEPHRQILRSTSIIGGASMINVIIGLGRNKVAALILGPAGIGLVGIFHNLVQTAAALAAFGIGNVGTRQLAEAQEEPQRQSEARRALAIAATALAIGGSLLLFVFRAPVASLVFGEPGWSEEVGWLSLGVGLMVAGTAQNGLLTGLRRIGDLARVSVLSAIVGTLAGIAALLIWRDHGVLAFVLVSPLATFLVGSWYVRRLPRAEGRSRPGALAEQWRTLARLGLAFTLAALVVMAGQLAVRALVQRQLGSEALGQFQASWTISLNYIGFILTAMAADYYPRLTAAISDPEEANRTINHQVEIALLLAAPILVGTVALAPLVVQLLYSSKFLPAAELLRWQISGDLLKIASWPLGFVLLAGGHGKTYVATEALAMAVLVGGTALALPRAGLLAPGYAYVAMYAVYLPIVFLLARRHTGFTPSRPAVLDLAIAALAIAFTAALTLVSPIAAAVGGCAAAALLGWRAAIRLENALPAPLARLVGLLPRVVR